MFGEFCDEQNDTIKRTEPDILEYVSNKGIYCLYCGSPNLDAGLSERATDPAQILCHVRCLDCRRSWADVYVLSSIQPANCRMCGEVADSWDGLCCACDAAQQFNRHLPPTNYSIDGECLKSWEKMDETE